ncbi:MAG: hypothetical protein IPM01_27540 [Burkholderiaceae bacterium]|nr:hypothetical protein [Burkholderiaceae bacterium]
MGRSTVERSIKSLVLEVARERGIPELDEDGLSCLPRLRQFREPVLRAVAAYTPAYPRRKRLTLLEPDEIAAGANRVRLRSENANRDVALIYVLFCTGAKPIEIARLAVRDHLNSADGRSVNALRCDPKQPSTGGVDRSSSLRREPARRLMPTSSSAAAANSASRCLRPVSTPTEDSILRVRCS